MQGSLNLPRCGVLHRGPRSSGRKCRPRGLLPPEVDTATGEEQKHVAA